MKNFKQLLSNLLKDQSGQDLIEYALVAGMMGLGAIATMNGFATSISGVLTAIGTKLTTNV